VNRLKRADKVKLILGLNTGEAYAVLEELLKENPDLVDKAYAISLKVIAIVDADTIMNRVYNRLDALEIDDLNGRAGRTRYGYVEPTDAAWELFEESLQPFINEMAINQKRALPAVAKAHCIGIVKGLLMYEGGATSDFSDWVVDAPGEYVDNVINEWKKGNPSSEDIAEVMSIVEDHRS
jgi:hypothetical protein